MKNVTINRSDIQGVFVTPPELQGTPYAAAFACTEDYILVAAAGSSLTAYRWPARGNFEPQNAAPKLGRKVGEVSIKEDM